MSGFPLLRLAPRALSRVLCAKQVAVRPTTLVVLHKINLIRYKSAEAPAISKSEYEIELERITKEDKYQYEYGFVPGEPLYDKLFAHMLGFFCLSMICIFIPVLVFYAPDIRTRMKTWRQREAIMLMEAREAKGEPLIDPNFAPLDLIESMVDPPGSWEEDWLRKQPSVASDNKMEYMFQTRNF